MNDSQKHWAGMFGGLRVPFDFRMMIIGFLAIIVFLTGNYIINIFAEEPYLLSRSIDCIFRSLGTTAHNFFHTVYSMLPGSHVEVLADEIAPNIWACGAILLWGLIIVVWFGALISRLTALRIAKEEKAPIINAIRFVWRRKLSLLLTPITIVILFALLYACNWILGCIGTQMTAAGTVVFILLFILVLIASFFMVCLSILLLFGVHLIPACIATEGCDGIETFISIFNYMFVRPWSYILYNVMIVFSLIFLVFAGGMFLDLVYQSSQISVTQDILSYHFDKVDNFVRVNYASLEGKALPVYYLKQDALEKAVQQYESFSPEEQTKRTKPSFYSAGMRDVWAYISGAMVDSWILDPVQNETVRCEHRMSLRDLWKLSKFWTCIAAILGLIYCIIFYCICGYLFAYVFTATTTAYFLLRKEVDDINFDEVWDEEKHREFLKTLKTVQKKTLSDYESMFSKHTKQEAENTVVQESEETKKEAHVEEKKTVEEKAEEAKENLVPEEKQEETKASESIEEKVEETKASESVEEKAEETKTSESIEEKAEETKASESVEEKQEETKASESVEEKQEEQPNITSEEESRKERKRKKLQLMKNKLEAARAKANENNVENKQEETAQQQEQEATQQQETAQEAVQQENKQQETIEQQQEQEAVQQENTQEAVQEENKQQEAIEQQQDTTQETVQEENKQQEAIEQQQDTTQQQEAIEQQQENQEAVREENKQQEQETAQQENTQEAVQQENNQQEAIEQQQEQETASEQENTQPEQEAAPEQEAIEQQQEQETAPEQENTQENIAQQEEQEPVKEEPVQNTEPEAQAQVQEDANQERENTRKIAQEFAQSIAKVNEEQSTSQEDTQEKPQEETSKNVTARFRHMPDFIPEPDTVSEPKKSTEPAIAEDSGSSDWDNFTFDSDPTPPQEKEVPPIEEEDSHSKIKLESGTMSIPLMTRPRYKYSARRRMEHQKNDFKKDDFID